MDETDNRNDNNAMTSNGFDPLLQLYSIVVLLSVCCLVVVDKKLPEDDVCRFVDANGYFVDYFIKLILSARIFARAKWDYT